MWRIMRGLEINTCNLSHAVLNTDQLRSLQCGNIRNWIRSGRWSIWEVPSLAMARRPPKPIELSDVVSTDVGVSNKMDGAWWGLTLQACANADRLEIKPAPNTAGMRHKAQSRDDKLIYIWYTFDLRQNISKYDKSWQVMTSHDKSWRTSWAPLRCAVHVAKAHRWLALEQRLWGSAPAPRTPSMRSELRQLWMLANDKNHVTGYIGNTKDDMVFGNVLQLVGNDMKWHEITDFNMSDSTLDDTKDHVGIHVVENCWNIFYYTTKDDMTWQQQNNQHQWTLQNTSQGQTQSQIGEIGWISVAQG